MAKNETTDGQMLGDRGTGTYPAVFFDISSPNSFRQRSVNCKFFSDRICQEKVGIYTI